MVSNMRREGYIILTIRLREEGDKWTAECLELGTATFGESMDDAEHTLYEAIELHLNTLETVGERKRFFSAHGIRFHKVKPRQKIVRAQVPLARHTFTTRYVQPVPAIA